MKIVPTEVTYQPTGDPATGYPGEGGPVTGMELHFLFLTQPGKTYQMRSTMDGINYKDEGPITLPPNVRIVVTDPTPPYIYMPEDPSPPAIVPTVPEDATTPKGFSPYLVNSFWAVVGAVFSLAATMLLSRGADGPAAAVAPPVPPPTAQPRHMLQVVTLFDCQYISFTEPFFILHLPQCSNCVARRK